MAKNWSELTDLTRGAAFVVERVRLVDTDIAIEGQFDLPSLACLSTEDQVFVAAFVKCHGSIKQMEKTFGVSYPTIKNRLNAISSQVPLIDIEPPAPAIDVLSRLAEGEISVDDALEMLK